jgi:hypothetical protein
MNARARRAFLVVPDRPRTLRARVGNGPSDWRDRAERQSAISSWFSQRNVTFAPPVCLF